MDRLLERLIDVRFLSVEFLNAFLTTYSIFSNSQIVLDTIIQFYHARKPSRATKQQSNENDGTIERWGSTPALINTYKGVLLLLHRCFFFVY